MKAKDYIRAVKELPCVLCQRLGMTQMSPTDAHHPRDGAGMGQRTGDYCVIALCHSGCHQGPMGIHGDRTLLRMAKVTEWDLHDMTNEAVFRRARW